MKVSHITFDPKYIVTTQYEAPPWQRYEPRANKIWTSLFALSNDGTELFYEEVMGNNHHFHSGKPDTLVDYLLFGWVRWKNTTITAMSVSSRMKLHKRMVLAESGFSFFHYVERVSETYYLDSLIEFPFPKILIETGIMGLARSNYRGPNPMYTITGRRARNFIPMQNV